MLKECKECNGVFESTTRQVYCEDCLPIKRKIQHLHSKFGIKLQDLTNMIYKANHKCEICKVHIDEETANIDHCHETGKIRGVLCWNCNAAIGKLGDNALGLLRALKYLIKKG